MEETTKKPVSHDSSISLNHEVEEFLLKRGAIKVGFATCETLAGGPPSTDLSYILSEACSAISFALPLDHDKIRAFLSKKDFMSHERDNLETNTKVDTISKELAKWLKDKGFSSKALRSNNVYRKEVPGWQVKMPPDLSHRYIAVRSGVGSFGWSGNVGVKGYGTAIILGSLVSSAKFLPTDPVPPEESFCTKCKLCVSSCAGEMFDQNEETTVTLGGQTFSYSKRINTMRCQFVCGGFTGLHPNGKWSTWSPGRFDIPKDDIKLRSSLLRGISKYRKWPERSDGVGNFQNPAVEGLSLRLTCGNCGIMCFGNKEDTLKNYRLLTDSGCVIQREDGEILVLPADEAAKVFSDMDAKHKRLYQ